MATQDAAAAPPGWYEHDGRERYWDGQRWTKDYRPLVTSGGGPQAINGNEAEGNSPVEYKVLTQKDRFFGGKFDPAQIEAALNAYAQQGWRMEGIATADIPSFGNARQEIVIVMSRSQ
jgi:hypothetical protein